MTNRDSAPKSQSREGNVVYELISPCALSSNFELAVDLLGEERTRRDRVSRFMGVTKYISRNTCMRQRKTNSPHKLALKSIKISTGIGRVLCVPAIDPPLIERYKLNFNCFC